VACAEALLGEPDLRGTAHVEAQSALLLGLCACAQDVSRARVRAEAILADAERQDDALRVTALLARAVISWREARLPDALDVAREAVRLENTRQASGCQGTACLLLGGMLTAVGQLEEADTAIGRRGSDARAAESGERGASAEILAGLVALAAGRPAEAADAAAEGLRLAAARGTHLFSLAGLSLLATTALRSGDLRTAARHVTSSQERLSEHGPGYGLTRSLLVAAQVAEVRGDAGAADQRAADLYSMVAQRHGVLLEDLTAPAWLVRFALSRGDNGHAEQIADAAAWLAAENPGFAYVCAAAAHARGLIDRDPAALSTAAAGCRDPWARASAAEDLGIVLARRQDRPGATRLLEDSLTGYDRVAALRDARRLRHRLRELGVRRRHFTYADRPMSGWASLTDTEHAVCGLVAQGLTNRGIANEMFLSTHTVAFHLRQVFRKLDIRSRVDLAREFTEQSQAAGKAWVY
jgi:DNA-binding CsgD family transcriptional regulator